MGTTPELIREEITALDEFIESRSVQVERVLDALYGEHAGWLWSSACAEEREVEYKAIEALERQVECLNELRRLRAVKYALLRDVAVRRLF
jgi:hypothetical protein